jgi:hypothetical protein
MRRLMSNGRVPKRVTPASTNITQEPMSGERARTLILEHRAPDGMRVLGHLDLSEEDDIYHLPENLTCESLDISDCWNITTLPKGLRVTNWIEIAGSGITSLPGGHGFFLRWRGVYVSDRQAFVSDC